MIQHTHTHQYSTGQTHPLTVSLLSDREPVPCPITATTRTVSDPTISGIKTRHGDMKTIQTSAERT